MNITPNISRNTSQLSSTEKTDGEGGFPSDEMNSSKSVPIDITASDIEQNNIQKKQPTGLEDLLRLKRHV